MAERTGRFDKLDLLGMALLAVILGAVLVRSVLQTSETVETVRAVAGVGLLVAFLAWRYAAQRLSRRLEGLLTLLVGVSTVGLLAVFLPNGLASVDGGLIAAYAAFFLYGLVSVLAPSVSVPTRGVGALLLVAGLAVAGLGLTGTDLSVGVLSRWRTVVLGGVVTVFGLALVLIPSVADRLGT